MARLLVIVGVWSNGTIGSLFWRPIAVNRRPRFPNGEGVDQEH